MGLFEYVRDNSVKSAGLDDDVPVDVHGKPLKGETADVCFFHVALGPSAERETFLKLVNDEYPGWLDGMQRSFLQIGAEIGDDCIALQTMAMGKLLNVWDLTAPTRASDLGYFVKQLKEISQRGLISIQKL